MQQEPVVMAQLPSPPTKEVILAKPQTFMNNSGNAIYEICHFYKIISNNVIIIHDELDIEFNKIKTKFSGGHAGHNGLKSIDNCITKKYHRIRIGIDHPKNTPSPLVSPADYVLSKFTMEQQKNLPNIFNHSHNILQKILI